METESPAMRPLRRLWSAVECSNIHIGLIAVCFTLGTSGLLDLPVSPPLLVLAFCGAFLVYQLERGGGYAPEDVYNHPERLSWIDRHRTYFGLSIAVAAGIGLSMIPLLRPLTLVVCVALGIISGLYIAPLLPGGRRLKAVWYLKPLLIGGGWAIGGVVLPVLQAGLRITPVIAAVTAYRFLFVLPNALWADWPDRHGDRQAGLKTAATLFSPFCLKGVALMSLSASMLIALSLTTMDSVSNVVYVDMVGPLLLIGWILRTGTEASRASGFVMDLIIAWPAVAAALAWGSAYLS